jgi:hypothetical protein
MVSDTTLEDSPVSFRVARAELYLAFAFLCLALAAPRARASCGAEGCPLDNALLGEQPRRFSFEVSFQHVTQNRVRTGTQPADLDHILHDGGELRTVSHVTTSQATYALNRAWRFSATMPFVDRIHEHVTAAGLPEPEYHEWQYSGIGDLSVLTNWTALEFGGESPFTVALQGGVKLPTGRRHVPEIMGEEPEPHARPGTGSTDLLGGLQIRKAIELPSPTGGYTALFASTIYAHTGRGTEGHRVGRMFESHLGASYPLLQHTRFLGQFNLRVRGKDDHEHSDEIATAGGHLHLALPEHDEHPPAPGEPEESGVVPNTGGVALFVTPGARVEVTPWLALSGYFQIPLYQRVNGTQLVSPSQFWVGATYKLR